MMIVQVCWPINTLIQPGSNYSLEVQAQTNVLQALAWDVRNSSLQLSTNASFRSLYPIVAIVRSPILELLSCGQMECHPTSVIYTVRCGRRLVSLA